MASKIHIVFITEKNFTNVFFSIENIISSCFLNKFYDLQKTCFNPASPSLPMGKYVIMSSILNREITSIIPNGLYKKINNTNFYISNNSIYGDQLSFERSREFQFLFPLKSINDIDINFKLSLNMEKDLIDIFDVCSTLPKIRNLENKSITEIVFKRILLILCNVHNINFKFSLGVDFSNTNFLAATKLYIKCGFTDPKLQLKLNINNFTRVVPFLKLDSDCYVVSENISVIDNVKLIEDKEIIERDFEKLKWIEDQFNKYIAQPYIVELFISRTLDDYLKKMLKRPVETSGSFLIKKSFTGKYYLSFVCDSLNDGTNANVYIKYRSPITMHTHPDICLKINNCVYAWPSGGDWDSDFYTIIKYVSHNLAPCFIVYSPDGYYISQPTEFLYKLIQHGDTEIIKFIYLSILLIVGEFEGFRVSGPPIDSINAIYFYVNTLNLINVQFLIERTKILLVKLKTQIDNNNNMATYFIDILQSYKDRKSGFLQNYGLTTSMASDLYYLTDPINYEPKNIPATYKFLDDAIKNNGGQWLNYVESQFNSKDIKEPLLVCNFNNELNKDPSKLETSFYFYNYTFGVNIQDNSEIDLDPKINYINNITCLTKNNIVS